MISTRVRQEAKSLLKKFRCIFQHSLLLARCTWPNVFLTFSSPPKIGLVKLC
jgi:hypothetical protein